MSAVTDEKHEALENICRECEATLLKKMQKKRMELSEILCACSLVNSVRYCDYVPFQAKISTFIKPGCIVLKTAMRQASYKKNYL